EKDGIKIAIHGMSGVPERFAKDILKQWNPQPVENCFNILLLHQSINPYIYSPLEPPSISISDLPKGFDLILDGHVHQNAQEKINGTTLIFPGSTVVTQFERSESEVEKGFYFIELKDGIKIEFCPLQKARKFFYEEIQLKESFKKEQIESKIKEILSKNLTKPPIIRIKLKGSEILDKELNNLEKIFAGKAILIFAKDFESREVEKKAEFLRALREQRLSVEDIGIEILRKNLEELNFSFSFDYEQIFRLLSEGEVEKTLQILLGEQKTLEGILIKSLKEFGVKND
ncbi:MAG: hypothetical protein QW451_02455, partial [Candidatus Aenigmatarchaeota archaeon]